MKKFISIALLVFVFSGKVVASSPIPGVIEEGSLFYDTPGRLPDCTRLGIVDDKLVSNDALTTIHVCESTALLYADHGKYLHVNKQGELVLNCLEDLDFELIPLPDNNLAYWRLSYKGHRDFQLCSDNSVRYQSDCDVVRVIQINYERDWSFETSKKYDHYGRPTCIEDYEE